MKLVAVILTVSISVILVQEIYRVMGTEPKIDGRRDGDVMKE